MNWTITARGKPAKLKAALGKADVDVAHADGEEGHPAVTAAAIDAAVAAAKVVSTGDVLVTIVGHETLSGEGFRPAHLTITVSKVSPEA